MRILIVRSVGVFFFLAIVVEMASGEPALTYKCQNGVGECKVEVCCTISYPPPADPDFCYVSVAQNSPICVNSTNKQDKCNPNPVKFACMGQEYVFVGGQDLWCDPAGKEPLVAKSCPIDQCSL